MTYNLPPRTDEQKHFWNQFWAGFGTILGLIVCEFVGGPWLVLLGLVAAAANVMYWHNERNMPLVNFFWGVGAALLTFSFDFMRRFAIGVPILLGVGYLFWRTYLQYVVTPILADRNSTGDSSA